MVSLGGGAWGYYGCQNQIASTSSCYEIEYPNSQWFTCSPAGKLSLVNGAVPAPAGTSYVDMHQCPGITSLGGGSWGYYGCQGQITNTSSCYEIEYPKSQSFPCTYVGKMLLASSTPAAPPGGSVVPMYQCPGITGLGGGAWGYYGCQGQITNNSTCYEIEYPSSKTFPCTFVGYTTLEP